MPRAFKYFAAAFLLAAALAAGTLASRAATVDELRQKSSSLSDQIRQLDAEIAKINGQLATTKQEKSSLSAELARINASRKKLLADLSLTQARISKASVDIQKLALDITGKMRDIGKAKTQIGETVRELRNRESVGLVELALSPAPLSDFLGRAEQYDKLQGSLEKSVEELKGHKAQLETKKSAEEQEKRSLTDLKSQLDGQKQVVEQTKKEKDALLAETKSKEANYQKMLADRLKKKKEVEAEIANIEQQIKVAIDPSSLPKTGTSILRWPLGKVIITQYFGNTEFATKNPQVYNGKGHNGVDFGTPIGSIVKAAADGQVIGTGDTDTACRGASYGKWVLIKHPNGLSSLYAHLSVIRVAEGQNVAAGDQIAYSGNTGYSTGPHLHFTVYASEGVKVSSMKSKVPGCGVYRLPLAGYNAYLNPLSYLGN